MLVQPLLSVGGRCPATRKERPVAAALAYDPDKDQAPRVVASGKGLIADRILERAEEAGVPIYKNAPLALTLAGLGLEEEIPTELYHLVAEVIAWVYQLENKHGPGQSPATERV
ncbi:MAG: EscU/YscU/HrcU family type III secretion system export apparatus switch protein [bacterium]|jgi:flagellar biosynthesis protein